MAKGTPLEGFRVGGDDRLLRRRSRIGNFEVSLTICRMVDLDGGICFDSEPSIRQGQPAGPKCVGVPPGVL